MTGESNERQDYHPSERKGRKLDLCVHGAKQGLMYLDYIYLFEAQCISGKARLPISKVSILMKFKNPKTSVSPCGPPGPWWNVCRRKNDTG